MAISGKLSIPRKTVWTTRAGDQEPMNQDRTRAVRKRAKATGTPIRMKPKREERKSRDHGCTSLKDRMSPAVLIRVWMNMSTALTGPIM